MLFRRERHHLEAELLFQELPEGRGLLTSLGGHDHSQAALDPCHRGRPEQRVRRQEVGIGRQDLFEKLAGPLLRRDHVHHHGVASEQVSNLSQDGGERRERHCEDDDVGRRRFGERGRTHAVRYVLELGVVSVVGQDLSVSRQRGREELPEVAVADDAERLEAHVLASVSGVPSNASTEFRLGTPATSTCGPMPCVREPSSTRAASSYATCSRTCAWPPACAWSPCAWRQVASSPSWSSSSSSCAACCSPASSAASRCSCEARPSRA